MAYMCSNKNKTGPICKKMIDAIKGYFTLYPDDKECYLNEGEEVGNGFFIAKLRSGQELITKDQVGL